MHTYAKLITVSIALLLCILVCPCNTLAQMKVVFRALENVNVQCEALDSWSCAGIIFVGSKCREALDSAKVEINIQQRENKVPELNTILASFNSYSSAYNIFLDKMKCVHDKVESSAFDRLCTICCQLYNTDIKSNIGNGYYNLNMAYKVFYKKD